MWCKVMLVNICGEISIINSIDKNFPLNKTSKSSEVVRVCWKVFLSLRVWSLKTVSRYNQVRSGELRAISRVGSALKTYHFYKMEEINTTSIDPFLWRKSTNKKMAKNVDISNEF